MRRRTRRRFELRVFTRYARCSRTASPDEWAGRATRAAPRLLLSLLLSKVKVLVKTSESGRGPPGHLPARAPASRRGKTETFPEWHCRPLATPSRRPSGPCLCRTLKGKISPPSGKLQPHVDLPLVPAGMPAAILILGIIFRSPFSRTARWSD